MADQFAHANDKDTTSRHLGPNAVVQTEDPHGIPVTASLPGKQLHERHILPPDWRKPRSQKVLHFLNPETQWIPACEVVLPLGHDGVEGWVAGGWARSRCAPGFGP